MKKIALVLLVLAVYVLHQDFWNWKSTQLVGFLPVGLAYHAGYSVLCAIMMFVLVSFAWPEHLEVEESKLSDAPRQEGH
jgi:hypothetical protein